MLVLSISRSFQCELDEGEIPCDMCGLQDENGTVLYACDGFKDAFHVALEGYSHSTVWLVFAAFQLGFAVEVRLAPITKDRRIIFVLRGIVEGISHF